MDNKDKRKRERGKVQKEEQFRLTTSYFRLTTNVKCYKKKKNINAVGNNTRVKSDLLSWM